MKLNIVDTELGLLDVIRPIESGSSNFTINLYFKGGAA
jgi:hypothetical protein